MSISKSDKFSRSTAGTSDVSERVKQKPLSDRTKGGGMLSLAVGKLDVAIDKDKRSPKKSSNKSLIDVLREREAISMGDSTLALHPTTDRLPVIDESKKVPTIRSQAQALSSGINLPTTGLHDRASDSRKRELVGKFATGKVSSQIQAGSKNGMESESVKAWKYYSKMVGENRPDKGRKDKAVKAEVPEIWEYMKTYLDKHRGQNETAVQQVASREKELPFKESADQGANNTRARSGKLTITNGAAEVALQQERYDRLVKYLADRKQDPRSEGLPTDAASGLLLMMLIDSEYPTTLYSHLTDSEAMKRLIRVCSHEQLELYKLVV